MQAAEYGVGMGVGVIGVKSVGVGVVGKKGVAVSNGLSTISDPNVKQLEGADSKVIVPVHRTSKPRR